MKKMLKQIVALMSIVAVIISSTSVTGAATTRLNKTSTSVEVGKTTVIKLVNNSKKVKWTVSNGNVKIISQNKKQVKVRGVVAGRAKVTAKVGNKKYSCNVKVKAKTYDASVLAKNIDSEVYICDDRIVAVFENKNNTIVNMDATLVCFDESGNMLESQWKFNYGFEANKKCSIVYDTFSEETLRKAKSTKVIYNVSASNEKGYVDKIGIESNKGTESVMVMATNNSGRFVEFIDATVIFYDENGNVIGGEQHYLDCNNAGSTAIGSFSYPYVDSVYDYEFDDWGYGYLQPSSYEVIVNSADN